MSSCAVGWLRRLQQVSSSISVLQSVEAALVPIGWKQIWHHRRRAHTSSTADATLNLLHESRTYLLPDCSYRVDLGILNSYAKCPARVKRQSTSYIPHNGYITRQNFSCSYGTTSPITWPRDVLLLWDDPRNLRRLLIPSSQALPDCTTDSKLPIESS